MTETLIDHLVADLTPRPALRMAALWRLSALAFAGVAGLILGSMGVRVDAMAALHSGALLWKPGLFLLLALALLRWVGDLSRPVGAASPWPWVGLGASGLLYAAVLWGQATPAALWIKDLHDPTAPYCFGSVMGGGGVALALMWRFWLRHTASPRPERLGGLAGLAAGALAAAAYALHCPQDHISFLTIYYGAPLVLLTGAGVLLGRRTLQW